MSALLCNTRQCAVDMLIIDYNSPTFQEVERKYQGWCKENYTLQIVFTDSAIKLDQKQENDTWKILPLAPPPQVSSLLASFPGLCHNMKYYPVYTCTCM